MKKVLLEIGFGLCFIATGFFVSTIFSSYPDALIGVPFLLFFGVGPALGSIALWKELKGTRSKPILISLGVWGGLITIFILLIFLSP